MGALLDLALHPIAALRATRHHAAADMTGHLAGSAEAVRDRYGAQRSERLRELEAAGKCLARSGKHANLRYWPADRGSRVLQEHRRQRQPRAGSRA